MNASIGDLIHERPLTLGSGGSRTGWKDQKALCSGDMTYSSEELAADTPNGSPQTAPFLTQLSKMEISSLVSFPGGGISSRGSMWLTALMRRLRSGSPGMTAGPFFPPFNTFSRVSS